MDGHHTRYVARNNLDIDEVVSRFRRCAFWEHAAFTTRSKGCWLARQCLMFENQEEKMQILQERRNTSWMPSICTAEEEPTSVRDWTRSHVVASPSPRDASRRPVRELRMQTALNVCVRGSYPRLPVLPGAGFHRFLLAEKLIQSCRIRGTYGISLQFLFPNEKCLCCNGVTFAR